MVSKIRPSDPELAAHVVIDEKFSKDSETTLTVWRKSLVFNGNGFTVFHPCGNLLFRVDNYQSDPKDGVVLMDATGMALLTMRRKWLSLHNEWQGFSGEFRNDQNPLFVMRRAPFLLIPSKTLAEVHVGSSANNNKKPHFDFCIEGCYAKRSFTILNNFNEVVAEVNPKQVRSAEITLGGDVFNLIVRPGHDLSFVMGLIIVLDQIIPSY